jgi:hypothetical protein
MPAKPGRKPVGTPTDPAVNIEVTLKRSDIAHLLTINPKNVSAAIRILIAADRKG